MLNRLLRVLWNDEASPSSPEPVEPSEHLEARFLRLICASSFERVEACAEARAQCGLAPGAMIERRDASGHLVDVRPKTYSSNLEAGIDLAFSVLTDRVDDARRAVDRCTDEACKARAQSKLDALCADLAEASRLRPVAARWALLRDLNALSFIPTPEPRHSATERPADSAVPDVPSSPSVAGFDQNLQQMRATRLDIERAGRDAARERFDERQRSQIHALLRPDTSNDSHAERVRLIFALARWDDENVALAAEFARA